MKILKGLGIVILALAIIYFALAVFGDSSYNVSRNLDIKAPADVVWSQVSNFKNWEKWSPWVEKDSTVENTYEGEMGQVGSIMSWVGDKDLSGTGSMTITSLEENKEINYDLAFVVPFEATSKGMMKLEENEGITTLTWEDRGDIPFLMRPFFMFMDLDAQIGGDFEKGLENINAVSQKVLAENTPKPVEISETTFKGKTYVGIRHKTTIAETMKSSFYADNFGKLGMYMGKNGLAFTEGGAPSAIYYSWNETDSTTEVVPAFPLANVTKVEEEGMELIVLDDKKALLAKHYGPYENTYKAHLELEAYKAEKGIETTLCIEEYVNDPTMVEPKDLETHIYYIVKE